MSQYTKLRLAREEDRDWNYGFTPTGTATRNTGTASGTGSTDVYDPRGVDHWGGDSTFDKGTPIVDTTSSTGPTDSTSDYGGHVGGYSDTKLTDLTDAEVDTLVESINDMEGGNPGDRNVRNNNPGNLEATDWVKSQPGYVGTDGRFAIFDSPEAGEGRVEGADNLW